MALMREGGELVEPEHVRRGYMGNTGQVQGDRVPPQSVELEMCVLGAVMLEAEAYHVANDFLTRDSFYLDGHGIIFHLMGDLVRRGLKPDSVAVLDELRSQQLLDKVGGSGVIMAMLNSVPTAANVEYHSRKVQEKAHLRSLIRGCTEVVEAAYKQEESCDAIMDLAQATMARIAEHGRAATAVNIAQVLQQEWEKLDDLVLKCREAAANNQPLPTTSGHPTGLRDADRITGGYIKGDQWITGALPSVGKTALMIHSARSLALAGVPCAIVSLEMNAAKLTRRLLCMGTWTGVTGIDTMMLKVPYQLHAMQDWQWSVLVKAYEKLMRAPLWIVDRDALTPSAIRAQLRILKRKYGIQVAFLDYLQLMEAERDHGSRAQDMAYCSRSLKRTAEDLDICIHAFSQLNNETLKQRNSRAGLHNLKESGAISADADVICLPYRKSYFERGQVTGTSIVDTGRFGQASSEEQTIARIQQARSAWRLQEVMMDFAKNRDGEVGEFPVFMRPALGHFLDAVQEHGSMPTMPPAGGN